MATIRVAVIQSEPVWLDLAGSVKKAVGLIEEAAKGGARIVAFAESWIPGYPAWIWARPVDFELQTKYIYNSLAIESDEMEQIKETAKKYSIAVVLGFSERSPSNSVYIAQAIISPQGELVLHRRKVKPTHMERTIFGDGSGGDLTNVAELDFGAPLGKIKVGTFACWEHTQPLLKYHSITQGEVIHISMWPPIDPSTGVDHPGLWSMTADGCQNLSQTYAIESGTYVLHATAVCSQDGIDAMGTQNGLTCAKPGGGHSCIIGPDGRRLTPPLGDGSPDTQGIVYGDLDLTKVVGNRGFLDIVGHYSRPDLLWLGVDKEKKEVVVPKVTTKQSQPRQEII
ncbi:carbon-nitrogen hydrolase [Annulohypoxylon maeteangense]|uniref:carbon-nitrogen hydrolase n=1 Tax=Annulohypoxylon maeteangense TaxID=1927788 RepID=UPI002007B963|nr:carbon-nitrogen hydrolase [Annulohypoxylon maeteangense]KAI0888615.1 carbon-nitrogen hydrolase [Annulohypoxylon maeteangense]